MENVLNCKKNNLLNKKSNTKTNEIENQQLLLKLWLYA